MSRTNNKLSESKLFKIEGRSTRPPGTAKFHRRKDVTSSDNQAKVPNESFSTANLCQQLLVEGYVQSYVDFYQLTHRLDPNAVDTEVGMTQIHISEADTIFIRDNLVKAELSRRQGDTASVYVAYNQLADYYVKSNDWKTSFFFHEKCLEVAQLTSDVRAEMSANHSLGSIYQLMANYEKARAYHERHEEIASSVDIFEEISKANVELYKVYLVLAEKSESQANYDEALDLYNKCLEAAKKSWDRASEGEANGRIGNLLLTRGEAQASLPYLKQQSQIAADLGHSEGRCRACSALALALDSLGQSEKALSELTMVVTISEQTGDAYLQAQACKALGTLFSKVGKLEQAVEILQRHFTLLKKILYQSPDATGSTTKKAAGAAASYTVTSHDLDLARAYIGISKGNLMLGTYTISLQFDLSAMLDWKLNRTDITAPAVSKSIKGGGEGPGLVNSSSPVPGAETAPST